MSESHPYESEADVEFLDIQPAVESPANSEGDESRLSVWQRYPRSKQFMAGAALLGVGLLAGHAIRADSNGRQTSTAKSAAEKYTQGIVYGEALQRAHEISAAIDNTMLSNQGRVSLMVWQGTVQRFSNGRWVSEIKDPIVLGSAGQVNSIPSVPSADPTAPTYVGVYGLEGRSAVSAVIPQQFTTQDRFVPDDPAAKNYLSTYRVYVKDVDVSNGSQPADLGLVALNADGTTATDPAGEIVPGRQIN